MASTAAPLSPTELAQTAALASHVLKATPSDARVAALTAIHDALVSRKSEILAANQKDMATAHNLVAAGQLSQSIASRLDLSKPGKYDDMVQGVLDVRDLPDPVGRVTLATKLDDGLDLYRVSSPIGVLLVIFEARPEVIANIASLALKSGNAAILKGGKESVHSFAAISSVVREALAKTEIPQGAIQLIESRAEVQALLDQDKYIDLVIPRGSNELVRHIKQNTRIPVLGHADGLCAVYIHSDADVEKAVPVVVDAKTDYMAACNAAETLLVNEAVLTTVWPAVALALIKKNVQLRCDPESLAALETHAAAHPDITIPGDLVHPAVESDYDTEFLGPIIAVRAVGSMDDAILHINQHSSGHTECILTESQAAADEFLARVDSAGVFHNASTRFADGFRYGFGTEVGISTNKIHARGPVGLEGLMIYKYILRGQGQGAGMYGSGEGKKKYLHQKIPGVVDQ